MKRISSFLFSCLIVSLGGSAYAQFQTELTLKLDLKSILKQGKSIRKCRVIGDAPLSGWQGQSELTDTDRDSIYLAKIDLKSVDIQHLIAYKYSIEADSTFEEILPGRVFVIRDTAAIVLEDQWNQPRVVPYSDEPFLTEVQIKEDQSIFFEALSRLHPNLDIIKQKKLDNWIDENFKGELTHRQFYIKLHQALYGNSLSAYLELPNQSLGVFTLLHHRNATRPYRLLLKNKKLWINQLFYDNQWQQTGLPLAILNETSSEELIQKLNLSGLLPALEIDSNTNSEIIYTLQEKSLTGINSYCNPSIDQIAISAIDLKGDTLRYMLDETPIRENNLQAINTYFSNNKQTFIFKNSPDWNKKEFILKEIEKHVLEAQKRSIDTILLNLSELTYFYSIEAEEILPNFINEKLEIKYEERDAKVEQIPNSLMPLVANKRAIEKWNRAPKKVGKKSEYSFKPASVRISPSKTNWPKYLVIHSGKETAGLGWQIMQLLNQANLLKWTGELPRISLLEQNKTIAQIKLPNSGLVIGIPLEK